VGRVEAPVCQPIPHAGDVSQGMSGAAANTSEFIRLPASPNAAPIGRMSVLKVSVRTDPDHVGIHELFVSRHHSMVLDRELGGDGRRPGEDVGLER
jgi:hypothetical protein